MMKLSKLFSRRGRKGQGIVEYAGAIVVASAIVAAAVTFAPTGLSSMFNSIITAISTSLQAKVK